MKLEESTLTPLWILLEENFRHNRQNFNLYLIQDIIRYAIPIERAVYAQTNSLHISTVIFSFDFQSKHTSTKVIIRTVLLAFVLDEP